jgi:hypothetical protein
LFFFLSRAAEGNVARAFRKRRERLHKTRLQLRQRVHARVRARVDDLDVARVPEAARLDARRAETVDGIF